MNQLSKNLKYLATACVAAMIGITATTIFAQETGGKERSKDKKEWSFCSNNNWSDGGRVSTSDLREMNLASTGSINVDGGQNGGVSVKGEDRADVLVRACVQAWAPTEEAAKALAASIKINTSGEIKAEGPSGDKNWGVSFEVRVPRATNTSLTANNGGISIGNVDGTAEFTTRNGGVNVSNLAGSVKGRTTNGGVNVTLSGSSWKGSGLDIQTTNGGVNLTMAQNYAANVETGTVNGGYKSDIPGLNVTTEDVKGDNWSHSRSKRINLNLNGGGAPIRVLTTNGGVKINTPDKD